jgi:DNA polymerase V
METVQVGPEEAISRAGLSVGIARAKEAALKISQGEVLCNPATTFLLRNKGNAMFPTLKDGELLIVDRSLPARHDDLVLVQVNGTFWVRRYFQKDDFLSLQADNPEFSPILMEFGSELEIWGVVFSGIDF